MSMTSSEEDKRSRFTLYYNPDQSDRPLGPHNVNNVTVMQLSLVNFFNILFNDFHAQVSMRSAIAASQSHNIQKVSETATTIIKSAL